MGKELGTAVVHPYRLAGLAGPDGWADRPLREAAPDPEVDPSGTVQALPWVVVLVAVPFVLFEWHPSRSKRLRRPHSNRPTMSDRSRAT